jgi:dTMP kinase
VIAPATRAGTTVLCDRFYDATIAYQGFGRGLEIEMLLEISMIATSRISPDLTLLIDIPAEVSRDRVLARGGSDRLEREDLAFHERVRTGYLALAQRFPNRIVILDGTAAPAALLAAARAAIERRRACFAP